MPEDLFELVHADDLPGMTAALDAGADPGATSAAGEPLLARASGEGRAAMVRLLLERGAAVDQTSAAGNSALMAAAAAGQVETLVCLLQAGADPARGNKWGFTALDWATWPQNSAEVLALLREANR